MQVTKRAEYAILSALYLARSRRLCDINEIAVSQNLSVSFTAKTLQGLTKAGILISRRGQGGGYFLARPADKINLLEIIQAAEGPIAISDCLKEDIACNNRNCQLEPVLRQVQELIHSKFESITLADIPGSGVISKKSSRPVILCDFDGTISKQDVSDTIFAKWLNHRWEEIDQEWHDGKISMVELYEECWTLVNVDKTELLDFIDKIEIDPYFEEFVQKSRSSNIPIYLVSDGFDFYIEQIMGRYGLSDLKYYSNHLSFAGGRPVLEFNNQHPDCTLCANCKKFIIGRKRRDADYIIYIGNGLSDRCAAEHADLIFAKDSLLRHCEEKGISCVPYEHFGEIIEYMKERSII
ncbi:MAG: MtnX-like HAD-IB family phosphatase [Actinobacteria bacterium]|nr:MtnX-like HAD-IB family phosphatase [Actinomycetota bacterium]